MHHAQLLRALASRRRLYVIADTSIEPMHVLPPQAGQEPTSWYRYMARYGPRVHNLAFYVDDPDQLAQRLEDASVRTTRVATGSTVFAHPKDTPGMLEFSPISGMPEPRLTATWDDFRKEFWQRHPLRLERLSHISILVRDLRSASAFYTSVLDAQPLPDQKPTYPDTASRYALLGEDTIVELAQPLQDAGPLARELHDVGQGAIAATFKVSDLTAAERHLGFCDAPVAATTADTITLDRQQTWGLQFRFTHTALDGDLRG